MQQLRRFERDAGRLTLARAGHVENSDRLSTQPSANLGDCHWRAEIDGKARFSKPRGRPHREQRPASRLSAAENQIRV
jgi:hypothetical protein